ncbi:hypothetical protein ACFOWE_32605 [Planomonospora corallina]|uniref:Serine/threonine protein kinase n=1 Tax=Planomonospora corallina TaxID=1806052 RepID=A0ABV8IMK3_9ACTN
MWPPPSSQDPQGQPPSAGAGQPPAGSWQQPSYGSQGQSQPPYGQTQQPSYGQPQPPYGQTQQPSYGQPQPPYGQTQQPSYGQPYNPQAQQTAPGGGWYPQPPGPSRSKPIWPWIVGVATAVVVALAVVLVLLPEDAEDTRTASGTRSGAPTAPASTPASADPTGQPTETAAPLDGRLVKATDGKSEITVPADWTGLTLLDDATVQQGNAKKEQYLMVISESQADFTFGLDGYAKLITDQMQTKLDNPVLGQPQTLTVNGAEALQYELHASTQGVKIVYWVTFVKGAQDFHQVLAWTLETKGEEHGPLLRQVTSTFKDLGGA